MKSWIAVTVLALVVVMEEAQIIRLKTLQDAHFEVTGLNVKLMQVSAQWTTY